MVANAETVYCARAMRRKRTHEDEVKRGATPPLRRTRSALPRERELWRRRTSMTLDLEPFMDDRERKEGLRRLAKWIEEAIRKPGVPPGVYGRDAHTTDERALK